MDESPPPPPAFALPAARPCSGARSCAATPARAPRRGRSPPHRRIAWSVGRRAHLLPLLRATPPTWRPLPAPAGPSDAPP